MAWCHHDYDADSYENGIPGHLFKAEHLPSLHLSLQVTRGQFSDMLRMLEAKRLKDIHFTVEDGANDSWPVFSWGMSAAMAKRS